MLKPPGNNYHVHKERFEKLGNRKFIEEKVDEVLEKVKLEELGDKKEYFRKLLLNVAEDVLEVYTPKYVAENKLFFETAGAVKLIAEAKRFEHARRKMINLEELKPKVYARIEKLLEYYHGFESIEVNASSLASELGLKYSQARHMLERLERLGYAKSRLEGRQRIYTISLKKLREDYGKLEFVANFRGGKKYAYFKARLENKPIGFRISRSYAKKLEEELRNSGKINLEEFYRNFLSFLNENSIYTADSFADMYCRSEDFRKKVDKRLKEAGVDAKKIKDLCDYLTAFALFSRHIYGAI